MGERTFTNILSKKEVGHNRSIYLQNGYFGESVVLILRYFRGGEFFDTLTPLEQAEIVAMTSYRAMFDHFYNFEGSADAMIYESEDSSIFATARIDPDLYFLKDSKKNLQQYLVKNVFYVPIDEYVKCEEVKCSDLIKRLVARFVEHYNVKPFTKDNHLSIEKEFFSKERQSILNESNNAFIMERYCNPDDYSSFVTAFNATPLGKAIDRLRDDFFYLNCVCRVLFLFENGDARFAPSYPLVAFDELDAKKPLTSFALLLSFVPTKEGMKSYEYEDFAKTESSFLKNYIKNNSDAIERLKEEFQQHSDVVLFEGEDKKVVDKLFALMCIAFEVRGFCREQYARCRALFAKNKAS